MSSRFLSVEMINCHIGHKPPVTSTTFNHQHIDADHDRVSAFYRIYGSAEGTRTLGRNDQNDPETSIDRISDGCDILRLG